MNEHKMDAVSGRETLSDQTVIIGEYHIIMGQIKAEVKSLVDCPNTHFSPFFSLS